MTEERMRLILDDIVAGVPKTKAFLANGICEQTGFNWANNDPTFHALMETAEAAYEANALKLIGNAESYPGVRDWRAVAMQLRMRRPEYRDNAKTEVNVKATTEISQNFQQAMSPKDCETYRALNAARMRGDN